MRIANLSDLRYIVSLYGEFYTEEELRGIEFYLSFKIRNTFEILFFLNDDNTILIVVERAGNFKCQLHFYTRKEVRGKETKDFFYKVIEYLTNNTSYSCFMTFIPTDKKAAKVAAKYVGFKELGKLEDAGGEGYDECLYVLGRI